jgi:hypothetical protein
VKDLPFKVYGLPTGMHPNFCKFASAAAQNSEPEAIGVGCAVGADVTETGVQAIINNDAAKIFLTVIP